MAATIKGKPSDQVSKPSIQVSKLSPILVDMGCARCGISHACKVMLKILQARLQRYVNHEFPDVQAGFRKGRGTRDQIANIHRIIEKAREFQKAIYFCFIDDTKKMGILDHPTCLLRNLIADLALLLLLLLLSRFSRVRLCATP